VIRKGALLLDGEQKLMQLEANVFRPEGDINSVERITFDTLLNGKATHFNFSGIEFYRTFSQ
jgi:hypothetical protein